MPNNVHYNFMQQIQQQPPPQSNMYNYQQRNHHHHHHHHRHHSSHHISPIPQSHSTISYSNHHYQTPITTPLIPSIQSSAYFLDRIDLENYTNQTLQQTVETILSKTKSKGLKVKLSLPDDGLVIDNIPDPNQSWIFKTSELLYFWRDPYYLNVIVVITKSRSRHHTNRLYSASIFRLRGTNSAQAFLQRAQQFFANLSVSMSASSISKTHRNKSVERLTPRESRTPDHNSSSNNRIKTKTLSIFNEQSSSTITPTTNHQQPSQPTTPIRRITPAEFDPSKIKTESNDSINKHRRYSDTASSTDSQTSNLSKEIISYTRKMNDDEDDKMTTISNNFSADQVAELMRELKELRNEIASLKLDRKMPPVTRSMSTSPLAVYPPDYSKKTMDTSTTTSSPSFQDVTSQSEVDAETQTDFSTINTKRRQLSKKNKKTMIGSGGLAALNKKKTQPLTTRNGRRTFSNSSSNTVSDQERTSPNLSSQMNDLPNDTNKLLSQEQYQPIILAAPPRPTLIRNQNSFIPLNDPTSYTMSNNHQMISNSSNSMEEGTLSQGIPVIPEKEIPQFLSTNIPSSNSDIIGPHIPIITVPPINFHSQLENLNPPIEHIYENVPILMQSNSNREAYYNIPIINLDDQQHQQQQQEENQSNDYLQYPNVNNNEIESQQQYLIPGQTISNSPPTTDNNSSESQIPQQKPQIISAGRHRNQPIYFANHLTNPIFNVDKQLLINTIANQFGVELNSPQLQQLVTNQYLFAARKRTFANMVWQLTPDEETDLCSSPITTTQTDTIDIETIDGNNSTSRSILKATKRFHSTPKRRNISWNSVLE